MPQQTCHRNMSDKETQGAYGDDDSKFHMLLKMCRTKQYDRLRDQIESDHWKYNSSDNILMCLQKGEGLVKSVQEEIFYRRNYLNLKSSNIGDSRGTLNEREWILLGNDEVYRLMKERYFLNIIEDSSEVSHAMYFVISVTIISRITRIR